MEQNKQHTAVEWYNSKITKLEFWVETKQISWKEYHIGKDKLIEQAKTIEKEQIIKAAADHCYPTCESARTYAEQYYNETYGTE
jgi:hypothetical protein